MTNEAIIRAIARFMEWRNVRTEYGGNILYGEPNDDWNHDVEEHLKHGQCGFPTEKHREPMPPWLTSHDALQPVLAKMSDVKWQRLSAKLHWISKNSLRDHLTMPARDLAQAIAEVVGEAPAPAP